ncbi:MAG: RNA polymerase sigma factor [Cyclobacteriaceae bacterium]|nr:RNA polymerase sigma factor [Cyclobacteriaceae bacterium]
MLSVTTVHGELKKSKTEDKLGMLSDQEIIDIILRDGGRDDYAELFRRYRPKVLDKSYSLLRDSHLAKDITNDILSRAYEKLPEFKGTSSFSTWLYSIAYNYCIDYLRSKKKLHYPSWNSEHDLPEIVHVEEEDLTELNYSRLMSIMESIHPEEKALLLMKYQDEMTLKQIAGALRISESAVKMRLQRAKARVLSLYKKNYKI